MQRFLREQGNWEPHLSATREVIIEEVRALRPSTVSVLGSGWLLDVPINELFDLGVQQITLYDISHPKRIRHKYANNNRLKFVDFDLTLGAVDAVVESLKKPKIFATATLLERLKHKNPSPYSQSDLVVSVNTLSQLHLPLLERIEYKHPNFAFHKDRFAELIQETHLETLPLGRSLLISEFEEEHHSTSGKLLVVKPRLHVSLSGWKRIAQWQWEFDTQGAYLDDIIVKMNVAAYRS